jgi:hypothetical protein
MAAVPSTFTSAMHTRLGDDTGIVLMDDALPVQVAHFATACKGQARCAVCMLQVSVENTIIRITTASGTI